MSGYGPHNSPLNRIEIKNIWQSILKVINFERGIGYTLLYLTIRPGETLNTYLFENRTKLVKPVGFLIFTVTIATFLTLNFIDLESAFNFGIERGKGGEEIDFPIEELSIKITNSFKQGYNILSLLAVPLLAFSSFLLFRKYQYNFAEHLVMNAYITGVITLFYVITFPLFLYDYMTATVMYAVFAYIYSTYFYTKVFGLKLSEGLGRGIGVNLLYNTLFVFLIVIYMIIAAIYWAIQLKG